MIILSSGGTHTKTVVFHSSAWVLFLSVVKGQENRDQLFQVGTFIPSRRGRRWGAQSGPDLSRTDVRPVSLGFLCVHGLGSEESRRVWKWVRELVCANVLSAGMVSGSTFLLMVPRLYHNQVK